MDVRPRVIAALAAHLRDLDLAEEAYAAALEACLCLKDAPSDPPAWIFVVAKRKAIDLIRRSRSEARAYELASASQAEDDPMADILELPDPIPDERLRLIFICCHPSLAPEARVALALKTICGLPVGQIARLFLISEQSMYQRITRAKTKVREAGIPFELPARRHWGDRLGAVLLTLELLYTVAYQDSAAEYDGDLAIEADRLATMVAELCPDEPEALGLAALIALARSRENARLDTFGAMIPLSRQDTSKWDMSAIARARCLLDSAAQLGSPGPCQIMALIQLTHARRAFDIKTDWPAILKLYDALMLLRPSPVVQLNRAIAVAEVEGAASALAELQQIPKERLENARPYHVALSHLYSRMGDNQAAADALDAALLLDPPRAERLLLERRRIELS